MNSGIDRVNSLTISDTQLSLRLRQQNRLLEIGAEKVSSSNLGQKDLGGSCLGKREVGNLRLKRRELAASRPTVRYKEEGRLLQVVKDIYRRLQTETEGAWRLPRH